MTLNDLIDEVKRESQSVDGVPSVEFRNEDSNIPNIYTDKSNLDDGLRMIGEDLFLDRGDAVLTLRSPVNIMIHCSRRLGIGYVRWRTWVYDHGSVTIIPMGFNRPPNASLESTNYEFTKRN